MDAITLVGLRETPLSVDEAVNAVDDDRAGGTAFFVGSVRDHDHGRAVTELSYSAHPNAVAQMRRVMAEVAAAPVLEGRPVYKLAALHRVGDLRIGDIAVVVAAAAAHREEAFTACRRLIDEIKAQVPIWKHQRFSDGTDEWVGACS